jgi:hypothetical protein
MPFKDDVPGTDWFLLFKKRHALSIKTPQAVEYARKKQQIRTLFTTTLSY